MLAFMPPISSAPRAPKPSQEPPRSMIGIVLAVALTLLGMTLPWLRHQGSVASRDKPLPHAQASTLP